eukprot:scaffold4269_cov103-Isochrysis_galbana.AAC.1
MGCLPSGSGRLASGGMGGSGRWIVGTACSGRTLPGIAPAPTTRATLTAAVADDFVAQGTLY